MQRHTCVCPRTGTYTSAAHVGVHKQHACTQTQTSVCPLEHTHASVRSHPRTYTYTHAHRCPHCTHSTHTHTLWRDNPSPGPSCQAEVAVAGLRQPGPAPSPSRRLSLSSGPGSPLHLPPHLLRSFAESSGTGRPALQSGTYSHVTWLIEVLRAEALGHSGGRQGPLPEGGPHGASRDGGGCKEWLQSPPSEPTRLPPRPHPRVCAPQAVLLSATVPRSHTTQKAPLPLRSPPCHAQSEQFGPAHLLPGRPPERSGSLAEDTQPPLVLSVGPSCPSAPQSLHCRPENLLRRLHAPRGALLPPGAL